jgi:hypothetical protein
MEPDLNLLGAKIEPTKDPGTWIGKLWRSKIAAILTCLLNPKILVPVDPGSGIPVLQEATIVMGRNGWVATLPSVSGLGAGGQTTGTGSAQEFIFVSDGGDFIMAAPWNGTASTGPAVKIAKQYKIRTSITTQTINGIVHTYTYTTAVSDGVTRYTRTDTSFDVIEIQTVNPPFLLTDIIYAVGFSTTAPPDLVAATLIMLDDGRAWAR